MTSDGLVSRRTFAVAAVLTLVAAVGVVGIVRSGLLSIPTGTTSVATDLLNEYGYAALFVIFVVEGCMLLYFAPSESIVPAAVVLLADGIAEHALVIGIAVLGATLGQTLLFLVAKRGGREYLLEKRWFRVSEDRLESFDSWFQRWGRLAVPVSNTLLFTRGMVTVPAGFSEMRTGEFVVLSALGTLSFETILTAVTIGVLGVV
jgi:membrane protein DedA with SNARE-associated domain